jgi:uncharacterized protein YbbC (DUF1343 family)
MSLPTRISIPGLALAWGLALPLWSCGADGQEPPAVRPGIQVLVQDSLHLVEGRRVGLVTNHTGILPGEGGTLSSIDLLHDHPAVELVALYSPEHGIRGTAEAGELVDHGVDQRTGLPVHSLYGETRKPTPAMLQGVEILLFDIQDIGTRYYTYVYTMALAMEAAGQANIPFVVLDRPNPIGGEAVQGNVLDPAWSTFVGMYPLPMRHGMTPGELAILFRDRFGVEAELHVVPADGWRRAMLFPETELPWVPPSPNMPDLESALHYPGTCLFEGTNLSVGRGTDRAFQWVGAPWLDGEELARRLEARGLPGVRFLAARFTPVNPGDGKFDGVEVEGVQLVVDDPATYDPAVTGVALLMETRRMSGERWRWLSSHFDRLAGTDALRLGIDAGYDVARLTSGWQAQLEGFLRMRDEALLYR